MIFTKPPRNQPAARFGIQHQGLLDQSDALIDVADEISDRVPAPGKGDSIVLAEFDGAEAQSGAFGDGP